MGKLARNVKRKFGQAMSEAMRSKPVRAIKQPAVNVIDASARAMGHPGFKTDYVTGKTIIRANGPAETKKLYRGMSEQEAHRWQTDGSSDSPVSWWSDGPDAARAYVQKNGGRVVEADVNLHPGWKEHYARNDIKGNNLQSHLENYPDGWGTYAGHGSGTEEVWYSLKNSYAKRNVRNVTTEEL